MIPSICTCVTAACLILTVESAAVEIIGGPITNADNGHIYYLLAESTWPEAEAEAVRLGGHLATINSQAEQEWVAETFYGWGGDTNRFFWIGLNDLETEGTFVWASGEAASYTNWRKGEPDNLGGEDCVEMALRDDSTWGQWNDLSDSVSRHDEGGRIITRHGVVEVPPEPPVLGIQMVPLLTIHGLPGDTNRIECVNAFGDTNVWIPLTNVVLTGTSLEWYDRISPPGAYCFYRAVLIGAGAGPEPGLRFVWLPPGQFTMGSPEAEQDRDSDEGPQTMVTFTAGFYIGRYEVTQGEYAAVMGSNPSHFAGDMNRPVERVNWDDAADYCARLTAAERAAGRLPVGWEYRLPTEAQWEYACRAGTTNRFSFGDDPGYTQLGNHAWYSRNSRNMTHPVGGTLPNRWGLHDMYGNVREWCGDWYAVALPGDSVVNPPGPSSGSARLGRGGHWGSPGPSCRSANRYGYHPSDVYADLGFRVALVPVP